MPKYDFLCPACAQLREDVTARYKEWPSCDCGTPMEPFWVSSFPNIIGDEIDYVDTNMTREPIRFTSKAERKRMMKQLGLRERVEHVGHDHTDKSPHTTRWV